MANDILVKVGADITDFSRKMAESNRALSNFSKANAETFGAFKKVGGALTKSITAPALAATTALTGITLVKGFQRLVGIDTARAKLSALGHDAESVEEIMNNALDSVRGTSFGMDEAATAAASAVAAGIEPGKELTKYLSTLGDAAAIAGTDFNDMASIFNKVQTAQRAYTGDLNQLADRGIPIYQWLAEEAGTTAEAVREMASKGEISSEMFKDAIEKNIGGAAKEIGEKSFMAALKNIGADIGRIGANFLDAGGEGEGFFSRLKPLLTEFRGFLQSLEEPAAELGKRFGDAFIKVVEGIKSVVEWFTQLSPTMKKIVAGFTVFATIAAVAAGPLLLLIGFIPQIIAGFAMLKTVALAIGGALGSISAPVLIVIALIGALIAAVVYAYRESEVFREAISTAFNAIKDVVMSVIGAVVDFIQEVWGFIVGWWEENNETIMSVANKVWDGISNAITSVMEYLAPFLEGVWLGIQTVVQVVWEFIKTVVMVAMEFIGGIISAVMLALDGDWSGAWEKIQDTFTKIWERIKEFGEKVVTIIKDNLKDKFEEMKRLITDKLTEARENLTNRFNEMKTNAINRVKEILSNIKSKFSEIVSNIVSKGKEIVNKGRDKFNELKDAIRDKLKEAVTTVSDKVGEMPGKVVEKASEMVTAGGDLVRGLIDGIKKMGTDAVEAIAGVVGRVVDKAKSLLKIGSPSKVFEQIGKWTGEGLAGGMAKAERLVERASESMTESAIPEIDMSYATPNGIRTSLSSAVSGTVDVNSRDEMLVSAIKSLERRLTNLTIEMEAREVGRIVEPHVTENQERNNRVRRGFT